MKQTESVDNIECPYCGHLFNGAEATNYDVNGTGVECPNCKKEMYVIQMVTYTAQTEE